MHITSIRKEMQKFESVYYDISIVFLIIVCIHTIF